MKQLHIKHDRIASLAARCLGAVTVCALALAPAFAFGGEGRDKEPAGGEAGVAIGDETIGTLPIVGGGSIELVRGFPILRPSFYLEGDLYELQNAISFFQGGARAEVVPLDPAWQRVRLVFVDEVLLAFDRLALTGADIEFGMWMPESLRCSNPSLSWAGRTFEMPATDSRLALPLAQMSGAGALDVSPLCVAASSAVGANALMAAADQDFLYLVQRH